MALIKCSECGKEISDKATSCPHCGNPIASLFEKESNKSDDELQRYLALARRAKEENNSENAAKYYDLALQKNPLSWEASFYQVYFTAMGCKIIQISNAAVSIANCLDNVLYLIKSQEKQKDQQAAKQEVFVGICTGIIMLRNGAFNHYQAHSSVDGVFNQCAVQIVTCGKIYDSFIHAMQNNFPDDKDLISGCAELYVNYIINNAKMYDNSYAVKKLGELQELVRQTKPAYTAPELPSSGGCYIATAVYGSYDCPEVWTLRRYRDNKLAKTKVGRMFIKAYYATSPWIVEHFGNSKIFNHFFKGKLDKMVADLQRKGFDSAPYQDKSW